MKIALVDASPKRSVTLEPLPLLKLGAWRKALGDTVTLFSSILPGCGEYDEIWMTTRYTYDVPFAVTLGIEAMKRAKRVRVGGISATLLPNMFEREGLEVHRGLVPEAEAFPPDYSILRHEPKHSITHTSRGCVRHCKFCMVHKLEPYFTNRPSWPNDLSDQTGKVLFYDNNWLAKSIDDIRGDVDKMKTMICRGRITEMDFNQGLDCRLLTEEKANLLIGLPIKPIRFAFDGMQEDGHYQRAVGMMVERGFTQFLTYVLYNFTDTPHDLYYRLKESVRMCQEYRVAIDSFPMRYQPIMLVDNGRGHVGEHWTLKKRNAFQCIKANLSGPAGTVTMHSHHKWSPLDEFEYWFGTTADEFDKLLSYPKIRELMAKRKGTLRLKRAQSHGGRLQDERD
jgi:hypothetical protein